MVDIVALGLGYLYFLLLLVLGTSGSSFSLCGGVDLVPTNLVFLLQFWPRSIHSYSPWMRWLPALLLPSISNVFLIGKGTSIGEEEFEQLLEEIHMAPPGTYAMLRQGTPVLHSGG